MSNGSEQNNLLAAYLAVGDDALKRSAVIERLRARLAKMGDVAFNSDDFDGELAEGGEIVSACNTIPFASPVRLVHVRNADKLKKADSEALVTYLGSPNETTVLLLEAEKLAKNTRLCKAVAGVGPKAVIDCALPKARELPRQVRAMATSHGIVMSEGAAAALVDLVGENTVHLDNELRKIALAHNGGDPVSEREVRQLVARTSEVKPWALTDAFAERNLAKCLGLLSKMDSASPHALIAMCTGRVRDLMGVQALRARGEVAAIARVLKVPDWKVKTMTAWARNFTPEELRRAVVAARDAERAMKSGSDPDAVFYRWLVDTLKRSS